jgi:Holliday junction resolvase
MWVVKASGEYEKFNRNKIKRTCVRAGAPRELADKISKEVERRAKDGMTTKQILNITLRILRKELPTIAIRYDLKGAMLRLGPAGFPFESLVAEILREYDYKAKVRSLLNGTCVGHEIDVIATKNKKSFLIECKYHNSPGIYTGIKEVLYTYARLLDLKEGFKKGKCQKLDEAWVVSNTRFSPDAIKYANCKKIRIIGWKHPAGDSLENMIEKKKLYPITMLRKMDRYSQSKFAKSGLLLSKDLIKYDINKLNKMTGVTKKKLTELIEEAKKLS